MDGWIYYFFFPLSCVLSGTSDETGHINKKDGREQQRIR